MPADGRVAYRAGRAGTPETAPEPVTDTDDPRSDQDLVAACNDGDAAAFNVLYRRHRDWVMNLSLRFTRDPDLSQDVVQETFCYLLRKFPGFELTAKLTTFLYPAVKHLSIAVRDKSRRLVLDERPLQAAADPDATEPGPDTREELAAVLAGLSDEQRETLLLRFVDDLELAEIAVRTDVPVGTVKSRIHHSLARLRESPRTARLLGAEPPASADEKP